MRAGFLVGLILIGSQVFADTANLQGMWTLGEIRYTGLSSDRAWERAQDLHNHSISVEEHSFILPGGIRCSISQWKPETLRNDMRTFGSFGGNWQEIGLTGADNQFDVMIADLTCDGENERLFRIISKPDYGLYLADFGRVFAVMQRQEANQ